MHEGEGSVSAQRLAAAVGEQVPALAGERVRPLNSAGTVIAPYRIGESVVARVPQRTPSTPERSICRMVELFHANVRSQTSAHHT